MNRAGIGRDDEIELHGAKATPSCLVKRMHAKRAPDAMSPSLWQSHVAAVGDMRPRPAGVCLQVVGAGEAVLFVFGGKDRVRRLPPIGEGCFATDVARLWIGFTGSKSGFEDFPDLVIVCAACRAYANHTVISAVM